VRAVDQRPHILHAPLIVRVLEQEAEGRVVEGHFRRVRHADLDANRLGAAGDHVDRLRERLRRDEEDVPLGAARLDAVQHGHRLGGRRPFVEQRRGRDRQPGQLRHHRLEIEERLEAALRDLRLVGGIGRVPAGVLEDVADDDSGGHAVGVAHADVRLEDAVLRRDAAQALEVRVLAFGGWKVQRLAEPDGPGDRVVDERFEGGHADRAQHGVAIGGPGSEVASYEGVMFHRASHFRPGRISVSATRRHRRGGRN
jgi:hypothetical protein